MNDLITVYFLQTGLGWAVLGAMLSVMLGGIGASRGIRIAASQGAGVLSEKPELFGKLFPLIGIPGTQGFYAFIVAFFIMWRTGIIGRQIDIPPIIGVALTFVGFGEGMVQWWSAIRQGETSAAAINLVAKRPEQSGRALILPALVETYALVALLAAILMIFFLTGPGISLLQPTLKVAAPGTGT